MFILIKDLLVIIIGRIRRVLINNKEFNTFLGPTVFTDLIIPRGAASPSSHPHNPRRLKGKIWQRQRLRRVAIKGEDQCPSYELWKCRIQWKWPDLLIRQQIIEDPREETLQIDLPSTTWITKFLYRVGWAAGYARAPFLVWRLPQCLMPFPYYEPTCTTCEFFF